MRPVSGVVKRVTQKLEIRLENGITLSAPKTPGYEVGDIVNLAYDFTKGRIVKILPHACEEHEAKLDQPEKETETGEIETVEEEVAYDDLCPVEEEEEPVTEDEPIIEDNTLAEYSSGSGALPLEGDLEEPFGWSE
jgi:hypothetical protein